jgi:hypothetical protein
VGRTIEPIGRHARSPLLHGSHTFGLSTGSSRRTPGPIIPSIGCDRRFRLFVPKRQDTAYGSRRSPGRRVERPSRSPLTVSVRRRGP